MGQRGRRGGQRGEKGTKETKGTNKMKRTNGKGMKGMKGMNLTAAVYVAADAEGKPHYLYSPFICALPVRAGGRV